MIIVMLKSEYHDEFDPSWYCMMDQIQIQHSIGPVATDFQPSSSLSVFSPVFLL